MKALVMAFYGRDLAVNVYVLIVIGICILMLFASLVCGLHSCRYSAIRGSEITGIGTIVGWVVTSPGPYETFVHNGNKFITDLFLNFYLLALNSPLATLLTKQLTWWYFKS